MPRPPPTWAGSTREAIARVRDEAWPDAATPDELHDALLVAHVPDRRGTRRQRRVAGAHGRARGARPGGHAARRRGGRRAMGGGGATGAVRAGSARIRGGARRDRARPARGLRTGHARAPSPTRSGLAERPISAALAALEARGLRAARPVHAGRRARRNGASGGCWRASIAIRSSACGPRSSPCRRAISCASCSNGSGCCRTRGCRVRMRVAAVLAQLEGFEAPAERLGDRHPAGAHQRVRARVAGRALPGRTIRLDPARGRAAPIASAPRLPIRSTPITLLARRSVKEWSAFAEGRDPEQLTSRARAVMDSSRERRRLVLRRDRGQRRHAARPRSRRRSPSWWRSGW